MIDNKQVLVTAVTSVYNQKDTIAQAIESILAVSDELEEYILLDDGSTDGTSEIVRRYAKENNIIKLLINRTNMGTVYSFRRLFSEARGNYVLGVAGDDYLQPEAMIKLITFAKNNPGYGLYFGNIFIEYPNKGDYRIEANLKLSTVGRCCSPDTIGSMVKGKAIPSAGMLIYKNYISDPKIYRDDFKWLADWVGNLIIALRYGAGYLPMTTVVWRVYESNFSAQSKNWKLQREVVKHMINVLKTPEYQDIYRSMVKYDLFRSLSWDIPRLMLLDISLWDRYTLKIILVGIFRGLHDIASSFVPRNLKNIIKKIKSSLLYALNL
jgi:glycosyltransferase involved in cell wall biosynthesis